MTEERFWEIIESARVHTAKAEQIEALKRWALSASAMELIGFQTSIYRVICSINRFVHLIAFTYAFGLEIEADCPTYDFAKCSLVMKGKSTFEDVLKNPDNLADFEELEPNCELLKVIPEEWSYRKWGWFPVRRKKSPLIDEPKSLEEHFRYFDQFETLFPKMLAKFPQMLCLTWHPDDRPAITQLVEAGDDIKKSRTVDHFFRCNDPGKSSGLMEQLRILGFSVISKAGSQEVHATEETSIVQLTRRTPTMLGLADKYQCEYDGWGCNPKNEQSAQ